MRTEEFWAVIDRASGGDRPGDPAVVAESAARELAGREATEIVAWGRHLDKVMVASCVEDLWAAAYLINGGCSDEGFDHFRGWLIAQGREIVSRAVREPDSLAAIPAVRVAAVDGTELSSAAVLRIADDAHRQVSGEALPAPAQPVVRPDPAQFWDFDDEEEMHRRLPRLAGLFLEPPVE